jgi:hypothetical protein
LEAGAVKWLFRIALAGIVAVLLWQVWQRFFVSDETRIRRALAEMTRAVEQGNLVRLEGYIAADYHDDHELDKASLLAASRSVRGQYTGVLILLSDITVEVQPDRREAKAVFIAKALASRQGGIPDTELFTDRFRVYFRQADRDWKVYRTESPELKFD